MTVSALTGPVVSVGEAMVEFARADGDRWRRGFAGDTLNVAWALRALLPPDQDVEYLSCVGLDDASEEMVDFIAATGIGTGRIARDPHRSVGLYTITTDASDERSFAYWRSMSAARRLADDPETLLAGLSGARLIYLSGITAAILDGAGRANLISVLTDLRRDGATIAYDPNYRPRLWEGLAQMRDFSQQICPLADIILPTFDDERAGFGDTDPQATITRLTAAGVLEIVVKNGTSPAVIHHQNSVNQLAVEAPVQPVDTTGAGDSFNGAYLAARLGGRSPTDAARAAQRVSAAVVMMRGALLPAADLRSAFGGFGEEAR